MNSLNNISYFNINSLILEPHYTYFKRKNYIDSTSYKNKRNKYINSTLYRKSRHLRGLNNLSYHLTAIKLKNWSIYSDSRKRL